MIRSIDHLLDAMDEYSGTLDTWDGKTFEFMEDVFQFLAEKFFNVDHEMFWKLVRLRSGGEM